MHSDRQSCDKHTSILFNFNRKLKQCQNTLQSTCIQRAFHPVCSSEVRYHVEQRFKSLYQHQYLSASAAMFPFPPKCSVPQQSPLWLWLNFKPNWTEPCEQGVEIPSSICDLNALNLQQKNQNVIFYLLPSCWLHPQRYFPETTDIFCLPWMIKCLLGAKTNIWIQCFQTLPFSALLFLFAEMFSMKLTWEAIKQFWSDSEPFVQKA